MTKTVPFKGGSLSTKILSSSSAGVFAHAQGRGRARGGKLRVYTDGACWPNPGPGGWAVATAGPDGMPTWCVSGRAPHTTNNRMELAAALAALRAFETPQDMIVYTDSRYLVNGMTVWRDAWQARGLSGVANADLWAALYREADRHQAVSWRWVRGHADSGMNNYADSLAFASLEGRLPGDATPRLVPEALDRAR